ncbi:MAG: BamA/TamA family outer membrane protein [Bacteroidota bacterium]|nr:BamA/TamA family outer membrane protein [Bacteroidota bacterium]MDP4249614.1 BamA/TamA family outer membrane protein [Bacteroidota bacterium]
MKTDMIRWLVFLAVAVMIFSCSETKTLQEGQYLYDGAKIEIKSNPQIKKKENKELKKELNALLRPRPNGSFLGIRFKLLIYNAAGTGKGKGLGHWIREKLGEPPVLASYSVLEKSRAVLQNRLENRGFFKDTVMLDTTYKGRKLWARYTAKIGDQYKIGQVIYPSDPDSLSQQIARMAKKSLLKKGEPYNLDVIKNERTRIDTRLKQRGYYYFSPDDLMIKADSTIGDHQVDMTLLIKKSTPAQAREQYRIGDVIVFADYDINSDTGAAVQQVPEFQGYSIIDPEKKIKPQVISRALVFKSGDLYNRRDHDLSLNRLITLGVFKFVKVHFDEADTGKNMLNAYYYLTPARKKSIRFEVSALTKSDDAKGGLLSINWRNRNFFRGAELFTASAYGGLEKQFIGKGQSITTDKLGLDFNLYFPKIISPIPFRTNSSFMPKTRLNIGYEFFNQKNQYTLNSFKTSFGYIWKESASLEHTLDFIRINFVNPSNIDPAFQLGLDTNLFLARSLERQFIIGPMYNFNLNTQVQPNHRKNNFYFNGNLDLSSNLLGIFSGADVKNGKEKRIFNTPYSQYIRAEADFRHYLNFSQYTVLATRITGGIGYAYGNSLTMPFVKQFFAGGANDIRAFRSRSLGPGSFYAGNRDTAFLADQPGDIKIEMNAELRFKLFSVVHWAFFVDAGNIWTLRADSARPGSMISGDFLRQVAVGVGTGLRLDVSILLIRLDLGIPVREPYLPKNQRWIFDSKNLVFNFAIGYPF